MAFYDGGQQPVADHDPTQQIQWEINRLAGQLGNGLMKTVMDLIEAGIETVEELIAGIVKAIIGFASIPGELIKDIGEWAKNLDVYMDNVFKALGQFNLWDPNFNVFVWADNFIDAIIRPVGKLLGINDPLPAFNLFGSISGHLLGNIPIESIGGKSDWNFLANPIFTDNALIVPGEWSIDPAKKHGKNGGSVTVTASGTDHDLYSEAMEVMIGQYVPMEMWTTWSGLVSGGTPIRLYAVPFIDDEEQASVLLDAIQTPGANQGSWVQLKGRYKVEDGISHVALRLHVNSSATAGQVWFSDGGATKELAESLVRLEWVEDLIPALEGIDEFFQVTISNILEAITGLPFIGWFFEDVFEEIASWFDDTQHTAAEASDAKGGLFDLIDAFLKGWAKEDAPTNGWALPGLSDFFNMGQTKSQELTEIAAGLALLQSQQSGNDNSGSSFTVAFEDLAPEIDPDFTKFYDSGGGSVYNDGNTLQFGDSTGRELFVYNKPLQTAYFETKLVVPKHPSNYFGASRGGYYLIGRANSPVNPTEYVFCFVNGENKARFGWVGGMYTLDAPYWFGPEQAMSKTGSLMTLRGGVEIDDRKFQLIANSTVVANAIDTADVSAISAAHAFTGFGLQHQVSDLVNRSPTLSHFSINDNTPVPTLGSYCRIYRNNTGSVGFTSGAKLPNNFMDQIDRITSDFEDMRATNSGIRVLKAGPYDVELQIRKSTTPVSKGTSFGLQLYVNSLLVARGGSAAYYMPGDQQGGGNNNIEPDLWGLYMNKRIYCNAGDVIYPGYDGSAFAGIGNADGVATYMTISRAGGA